MAVHLQRRFFDELLQSAVHSSYVPDLYGERGAWQSAVAASDVRLQWDPDHDPGGQRQERRAIQLGLRRKALSRYGRDAIVHIEDISAFVAEQRKRRSASLRTTLLTPCERPYPPPDRETAARLGTEPQIFSQ